MAIQITAKDSNPCHRLPKGWRLIRRAGDAMDATVERAPFDRLKYNFARQVAIDVGK